MFIVFYVKQNHVFVVAYAKRETETQTFFLNCFLFHNKRTLNECTKSYIDKVTDLYYA